MKPLISPSHFFAIRLFGRAALVSSYLAFFGLAVVPKVVFASTEITAQALDDFVVEQNAKHPTKLSGGLTIQSVARTGRTLIFRVLANDEIDWIVISMAMNNRTFQKKICEHEPEKSTLRGKVNFAWNYFDRNGKLLGTAVLTPSDCGY